MVSRHFGRATEEKNESQDICCIPAGDRIAFLKREGAEAGFRPGDIVDRDGNRLGSHDGIAHYTLGQRKGLGLPNGPWHVVALDGTTARVVVAHPEDALIRHVEVGEMSWIRQPGAGEEITAKVRYQMQPALCAMEIDQGREQMVTLSFDAAQKPTAPGQVAAFYVGDELIGGGIVSRAS